MNKTTTVILFVIVLVLLGGGLVVLMGRHNNQALITSTNQISTAPAAPTAAMPPRQATDTPVSQIVLTVATPQDGATVSTPTITVSGKTVALADVVINDTIAKADSTGNFSAQVTLDEGENPIVIVANDESGNYTEKDLTITYTPQGQ